MLNKYRNTECVQKMLTVLDIEQVLAAIKDIPQIKKNYKRICDAVKEYESLIPGNIFTNNDTSKIDEIFNAVRNNNHHSDDNFSSEFEERKT